MRTISGPALDELVIEVTVEGFLSAFKDADYHLFRQDGNEWEPVDGVRNFGRTRRVRGVLKGPTWFSLAFDQGEFYLRGGGRVSGELGFEYKVESPYTAMSAAQRWSHAIRHAISRPLREQVEAYDYQTIEGARARIMSEINAALAPRVRDLGVLLALGDLALVPASYHALVDIEGAQTDSIISRMRADDELYAFFQMGQAQNRLLSDKLQIERRERIAELLDMGPIERARIAREAEQIFLLGSASVQVDALRTEQFLQRIRGYIAEGIDPFMGLISVVAMESPESANAIARALDSQLAALSEQQRQGTYRAFLEAKARTASSAAATATALPSSTSAPALAKSAQPMPAPGAGLDEAGIKQAIRGKFPDVKTVDVTPMGSHYEIAVRFQYGTVRFLLAGTEARSVHYGRSKPDRIWRETVRGSTPEATVLQLVERLYRYIN